MDLSLGTTALGSGRLAVCTVNLYHPANSLFEQISLSCAHYIAVHLLTGPDVGHP